jgi:hypothetical protein
MVRFLLAVAMIAPMWVQPVHAARLRSCPNGVVADTCECRAVISGRREICRLMQHCIRHNFAGTCRR